MDEVFEVAKFFPLTVINFEDILADQHVRCGMGRFSYSHNPLFFSILSS